ncbi:MAG: GH25 family lysozyme [Chloroflexota bacterium]
MPLAIDVSNFTGPIDAARASALHAAGVRRAVVGTQYPGAPYPAGCAHLQIPALLDAGIEVQAYVYLWFAEDASAQVRAALDVIVPWRDRIARLWIDVEDESGTLDAAARVDVVARAVATCGAMPTGIYTAAWFWRSRMDDATAFAALPLWAAQYDGGANLEVSAFGGWACAAMKQYDGDATLAGLSHLDLDWYEESLALLTEAEFGFAFATLYRGMDGAQMPVRVRWGEPTLNADGDEVHPLVIRGRSRAST